MNSKKKKPRKNPEPVIYGDLFAYTPTKSQRTIVKILEAAIENYATIGSDQTNSYSIAKTAGVSRSIVQHYFPQKKDIFENVARYVRANFQRLAITAIETAKAPEDQLEAYIRATFEWVETCPQHVTVWMLFYYYCAIDPALKGTNNGLVELGFRRISAILELGIKSKAFRKTKVTNTARMIQMTITGALVAFVTEEISARSEGYKKLTVNTCLELAGLQK